MEYSQTVNLPKTDFSMKAGLVQKEPQLLKMWETIGLYKKQLEKRKNAKAYILHDGPPYANGEIHVGTALNKVLKDIINKYKFLSGYRTPYVPGWDCHGLPIELKVMEKLGEKAERLSPITIRKECREYAQKFVKVQMEGFKRLGVLGDFENPYLTMSEEYEAAILEAFGALVERNHVYRGLRPVHWCIHDNTSLAEAEIEYHDHTSPSIYVKFPVAKHSVEELKGKKVSVLIWTTTPWTLPANTGLSFHPDETYVAAKTGDEYLVMAEKLRESVFALKKLKDEGVVRLTRGDLEAMDVRHVWIDRESRIVFGHHVSMDTGSGIVHTAPGHGMEDYVMGIENRLPLISPVDDKGKFTKDVPEFEGQNVFDANEKIIKFLEERGSLYFRQDISHSYPHCWRCKKPIIFRSKPQWFFRVSDEKLQASALHELSKVRWVPEWGEVRMKNMIEGRPDWCLSRQRNWGVPIPAFYCEDCGEAMLSPDVINHVIGMVRKEGIEVWFKKEPAELMPVAKKCAKCGGTRFKRETDILDVWFDSGVSHIAVLDKRDNLKSPADVYLEGNDQYRGWFQSSLWPSLAIKNNAPFKTIITHGWVLDEQGRQMHKSLGNTVSPKEVYDKYGADVLRLWVVSEDYRGDLRIGEQLIQKCVDNYRKIRNTFRYLMGNLDGFDPASSLKYNDLLDADKYILSVLYKLNDSVKGFSDNFEFYRAFKDILNFCTVDLSAFYLDILKDRLYIYPKTSRERLSAQTVMFAIVERLMIMLAPVLCFTMEEVYQLFFLKPGETDSVHLQDWKDCPAEWNNAALAEKFSGILGVRETVLKAVEILRSGSANGGENIGSSLEARVEIKPLNEKTAAVLKEQSAQLRYLFIVSEAAVKTDLKTVTMQDENAAVFAEKAKGAKCARCWNYSEKVGSFSDHPELCERCHPIVTAK